jgi:O-antigen/teichoic acid export membrane protein
MFFQQQSLRGFHEIRYMVIGSSFLQLAVKVLLTVVLFAAGWRLAGYVLAVVLSSMVAAFWMSAGLWRRLRALPVDEPATSPSVDPASAWRTYAKVQYADSLVGLGASYLDRFLLAVFASATSVGVLAIVRQLQALPVVFLNMFISVAAPMFAAAHSRDDDGGRQHIYGLATDWVVKASAPLLIFLLLYARPVLDLYGPGVAAAGTVPLCILVVAQVVNVLAGTIGTVLNMSGCEKDHLRITIVQTIAAVILLILLTPPFGLAGIAVTVAAGTVFNNVASFYVAKRRLGLHWYDERFKKWPLPLVMATSAGLAGWFVFPDANAYSLVSCLVSLYGVFFAALLAQGLNEDDRELLGRVRMLLRRPA